jgi:hypothetical protein
MMPADWVWDGLLWPRHIEGEVVQVGWRAYPVFGSTGTLAVAGAVLLGLLWIHRRTEKGQSPSRRGVLLALRITALTCLLPAVLDLSVQLQIRRLAMPVLAVAIDASQSMSLTDRYATPEQRTQLEGALGQGETLSADHARLSRLELVRRMLTDSRLEQLRAADLRLFAFDSTARPLNGETVAGIAASIQPTGPYTSLAGGINEIVDRLRGQPVAGVLLFSDGANNSGGAPAAACDQWRQAGVAVHAVVVGDPEPRDIEICQVISDDLLFAGEPATILARVRHRGYKNGRVPLLVRNGPDVLARMEFDLDDRRAELNVPITFRPAQAGEQTFTVECPPQADEAVEQNNRRSFVVRVTTDKIRVLYMEGRPRWQFRFLRDAMTRDRRLALQVLLAGAEPVGNPAPPMIAALPSDRAGFDSSALIILGDLEPAVMTAEQMEWIRDAVRDKGSGLLLLAGPLHNPRAYTDTPLADLIPIESGEDPGRLTVRPRAGEEARFTLQLTPAGRLHPAIQLGDTPEQNAERWESLPSLFWYAPVRKVRAGANVLAVHPGETTSGSTPEALPLLAVQQFGRGRVFYTGIDETWRWRFKRGDQIFYRFWDQVIQYLGTPHLSGAQGGMTLRTDRAVYGRGETALITVRADNAPDPLPPVVVESDDGRQVRLALVPSPGAEQFYGARFTPATAGGHRLWVEGHILEASTIIEVESPQLEWQNPAANVTLMKEIAAKTGGQFARPGDFDRLLDHIDLSPRVVQEQRVLTLWDLPAVAGLFVVLLGTEWVLRRLWQLP